MASQRELEARNRNMYDSLIHKSALLFRREQPAGRQRNDERHKDIAARACRVRCYLLNSSPFPPGSKSFAHRSPHRSSEVRWKRKSEQTVLGSGKQVQVQRASARFRRFVFSKQTGFSRASTLALPHAHPRTHIGVGEDFTKVQQRGTKTCGSTILSGVLRHGETL